MVYPDVSSLPAITAAITTVYVGDVGWGTGWTMAGRGWLANREVHHHHHDSFA